MTLSSRFATSCMLVLLLGSPVALSAQYAQPGPPAPGQGPGGWDAPPSEYNEIQQRGFRDGIEGARKDYENHRRPDVRNRDEFRHPNNVPRPLRADYRASFQRGYDAGVRHMMAR